MNIVKKPKTETSFSAFLIPSKSLYLVNFFLVLAIHQQLNNLAVRTFFSYRLENPRG